MHTSYIQIGEHCMFVSTTDGSIVNWLHRHFKVIKPEKWEDSLPDIYIRIRHGYGKEAEDYEVRIRNNEQKVYYQRDDYLLETDRTYRRILLSVHDDLALKHALMAMYSAFIVHCQWGLMLHSSCVVDRGKALLFAGKSGAGKSTVAKLSDPRPILADEATLVKIGPGGIVAYDSPFRSDSMSSFEQECRPLGAIYLLEQSALIEARPIRPTEAVLQLMDKIFYWAFDCSETVKVLGLCRKLTEQVPTCSLLFQKNDLFWERIS